MLYWRQVEIQKAQVGDEVVLIVRSNYWRFREIFRTSDFQRQNLEDAKHVCHLLVRNACYLVSSEGSAEV